MIEVQWNTCTEPATLLDFLRDSRRASERRLRLFACACCRRIWHLLTHPASREDIQISEDYADGLNTLEELKGKEWTNEVDAGWGAAWDGPAWMAPNGPAWLVLADQVGRSVARQTIDLGAVLAKTSQAMAWSAAAPFVVRQDYASWKAAVETVQKTERQFQASLLRDIFGNPFRPPPPLDPAWLTWNGGTVKRLAEAIYEERAFTSERMGVLADALEEAGSTQAALLEHLRGPGPHYRGCWGIDLLLNKG